MLGSMIRAPPAYKKIPDYGWAKMDSVVIVNGLFQATPDDQFLEKLAKHPAITSAVRCVRLEPRDATLRRAILVLNSSEEAKTAATLIRSIQVCNTQQKKLHVQHFAYRKELYSIIGYFTPNVGTYCFHCWLWY